jgi:hypothetical protein
MNSTTSRCEQHARVLEPIGVGIPTSAALLPQAYRLLSCEQFEQSATCAVRASCIDPASSFARLRRGLALSKAGRRREAPDQLARAVTPAHQDAQIRYKPAIACASDEILFAAFLHTLGTGTVGRDASGVGLPPRSSAFAPIEISVSASCLNHRRVFSELLSKHIEDIDDLRFYRSCLRSIVRRSRPCRIYASPICLFS